MEPPSSTVHAVVLAQTRWLSSFPVRALREQTWHVAPAGGEGEDASSVTICSQLGSGKSGSTNEAIDKDEEDIEPPTASLCLGVVGSVTVPGRVPLPPRRFYACPGSDLRCFDVSGIRVGMRPTANDTFACSSACDAEAGGMCKGWVFHRPESTKNKVARCCLKKEDIFDACFQNHCCDAHMASETKAGLVTEDASRIPRIHNVVNVDEMVSPPRPLPIARLFVMGQHMLQCIRSILRSVI